MRVQYYTLFLATPLICCIAGAQTEARFPSHITTRDNTVYRDTAKVRVEPDGILVSYHPAPGGVGWAKLKFRDLPDDLQRQYGYEAKSAAEFEKQEAQATDQWRSQMAATDALAQYRSLAEMQSAWVGDGIMSSSVSLDANGKVSAQATASTLPPEIPPDNNLPQPPVSYSFSPLFFGSLPFQGYGVAPGFGAAPGYGNPGLQRFRQRPSPLLKPR